jgi:hypothetical protein
MGSQQLLLIVVGVIVVGLTVYSGINIGRDYMENSNREQIISNLYDIGLMAQQYYKKEASQGGGGKTFTGWVIPQQLRNTQAGTFEAIVTVDAVNLSGSGTVIGRNGITVVRATAKVDQSGIRVTIIN